MIYFKVYHYNSISSNKFINNFILLTNVKFYKLKNYYNILCIYTYFYFTLLSISSN